MIKLLKILGSGTNDNICRWTNEDSHLYWLSSEGVSVCWSQLEPFLPFIKKAYGSLNQPDYSFVETKLKNNPYRGLLRNLSECFAVDDVTSKMDDVCFRYVLRGPDCIWGLDLSMVGPFGLFMRLSPTPSKEDVVDYKSSNIVARERKVLDLLREKKIRLVTATDLEVEVDLKLVDRGSSDSANLYQSLFSDGISIPWKS